MKIGDQLRATKNWGPLLTTINYYFLCSDYINRRVLLVIFTKSQADYSTHLISMDREEFERGLLDGLIIHDEHQRYLPMWLEELEAQNVLLMEHKRKNPKKTNAQYVQERFLIISEAILMREEILSSNDPVRMLNLLAKTHEPKQHPSRFKLWFFAYTLFSDNIWSLLPKFHNIGKWDRSRLDKDKRCGRKNLRGEKARYHADLEMQEKIQEGFVDFANTRDTWDNTYQKVMRSEFGCLSVADNNGNLQFVQPNSKPFPSIYQFRYWVQIQFAEQEIRVATRGIFDTKAKSGSKGHFSEGLSNLYQKVEFDGYYFKEKLTALDGKTPISGFCVVRGVCAVSGAVLGVGFAKGSESLEAYLMCLFSMAIDKTKFCDLFGLNGSHFEWPCVGLTPGLITDRGPGSVLDMYKQINWLNTIELTPSGSGQSKATVESGHPRTKVDTKTPSYFHSSHDYVRMAKREIAKACLKNHASNARHRMTPEMLKHNLKPTPHSIWRFLDERARSSARNISYADAVRKLLSPREVKIKSDGVWLMSFKYSSKSLGETGIFNRAARSGVIEATAYVLNMCVRHIWLDFNGDLYELSALLPIRTADADQYVSIYELEELDKKSRVGQSDFRASRPAVIGYYHQLFAEGTGSEMDDGQIKAGQHKKTAHIRSAEVHQKRLMS